MAELSITPKRSLKTIPHLYDKTRTDTRERKRCILYLIHNYLLEQRLCVAAEALENEAQLDKQYQTCENIDLEIILQEYQSYYYTKFQKYPKILRKAEVDLNPTKSISRKSSAKSTQSESKNKVEDQPIMSDHLSFPFEIISLTNGKASKESVIVSPDIAAAGVAGHRSQEWKDMADLIMKECIPKNIGVTWKDCISLTNAIEKLKEATIYPRIYPKLFENFPTWKGILLFGPPGTGKTLLAKALASEGFTFINVSSSTFISKWRGDSEKMLRVLFDLAKIHAPTTIFIDELDAVASSTQHQHEASFRFKSELLTQIDGVQPLQKPIFILGSTNAPWNLGAALLRRFEKRILVPLPNLTNKIDLLRHYLPLTTQITESELEALAKMMMNFSGSDIKTVCKDVHMSTIRERIEEMKKCGEHVVDQPLRRVVYKDVQDSLWKFKPCITTEEIDRFEEWNKKYGAW